MAHKSEPMTSAAAAATLQRGKACLRCRKRKMRCDGTKPACQQCTRARKSDCCEYDDGKGKTRTQLLRENIVRLEERIRELEDPHRPSSAFASISNQTHVLHDHDRSFSLSSAYSSNSPTSSAGSPRSASLHSVSPYPQEAHLISHSPPATWTTLPELNIVSITPSTSSPYHDIFNFEEPQPQPPVELSQNLIDLFTPHARQCGIELNMARLRESVLFPASEQRSPALMNAIFLWACYLARPGPLCQHESHYLQCALTALTDARQHAGRLVDVIQAECLLSLYFLSNGRMLEGSYHSAAAATLALQLGLQKASVVPTLNWDLKPLFESFELPPPKDVVEEGERVLAFWQAYNLDTCWSVILRKPSLMSGTAVDVPWPQRMEEYEAGHVNRGVQFQTVQTFLQSSHLNVGGSSTGYTPLALRVKASALFDKAEHLATSATSSPEELSTFSHTVSHFLATLPSLHHPHLDAYEKHILLTTHTLAHAALINLSNNQFISTSDDLVSYNKCLGSARAIVSLIESYVGDADYDFLDAVVGPCWTSAADVLVRELNNVESSWPLLSSVEVRGELGTLLYGMTGLSVRFPLMTLSAAKVQKRLAQL